MPIKNYEVVKSKEVVPGVKFEAIGSKDGSDCGISIELDLKSVKFKNLGTVEIDDKMALDLIKEFMAFLDQQTKSVDGRVILKKISDSEWKSVADEIKKVAAKYKWVSVEYAYYGSSHDLKVFVNDKLIFVANMPHITEDFCKSLGDRLASDFGRIKSSLEDCFES